MSSSIRPAEFAAEAINTAKNNAHLMCNERDGGPRNLTFEQAAAANQALALNAIAAALLAVADAISEKN